jgi:S-adenosylmethionine synthetase
MIYISTDYVFPGKEGEAPYSHDSPTSPPNFYGETKLAGEEVVKERGGVVFRVPVLYGETEYMGESAVNTLMDTVWNKAGKPEIEMDAWSIRYPTNTMDVARVLKDVADLYKQGRGSLPEILQFSAEERFTKYEICKIFADVMGLPHQHIKGNAENDPNSTGELELWLKELG